MIADKFLHGIHQDHRRKSKAKSRLTQVSAEITFRRDLIKYEHRKDVVDKIVEITDYFKNRNNRYLASHHADHELSGKLSGFRSLALYPGERGINDIVIIYKKRKNHIVYLNIGSHSDVYGD